MRNRNIFESVNFLNETAEEIFIEFDIDLAEDEALNEQQVLLKFMDKDQITDDFKEEALKIAKYMEEKLGKKASEGALAAGVKAGFGIRINNAVKKIEKKPVKKVYTLNLNYRAMTKAAGTSKGFIVDSLVNVYDAIADFVEDTAKHFGYKKLPVKQGRNTFAVDSYVKDGKNGAMYNIDCALVGSNIVNMYIRCLKNTEENKACLVGGVEYYDKDKKD